uniref:Membrane protein BRI3 n=1 Tax=Suricata suricatta TaxID=37032 RepID=A0A673UZR9_SURSU
WLQRLASRAGWGSRAHPLPGSRRSRSGGGLVPQGFCALLGTNLAVASRTPLCCSPGPPALPRIRPAVAQDPPPRSLEPSPSYLRLRPAAPRTGSPAARSQDVRRGGGGIPTHHPRVYNIHSRNVTRYPANSIVVVGGCPVCRVGVLEDSFTFLGIFLAIILFPFGFICCFALRKRRCPNCGANFT